MKDFEITKTLKNGLKIELYMNLYGQYVVTVFTSDYKALESKRTTDYFNALHKMTILENKYSK